MSNASKEFTKVCYLLQNVDFEMVLSMGKSLLQSYS